MVWYSASSGSKKSTLEARVVLKQSKIREVLVEYALLHLDQEVPVLSDKKEDEDDMNDFFDQFEKETGGENFKR